MTDPKPRRRNIDSAQMLKVAALHYGSVVLTRSGPALEEAEKKLKLAALTFYQASRFDEEDKAISTLLAIESDGDVSSDKPTNDALLGFAEGEGELKSW